jgi:hypothetical protein
MQALQHCDLLSSDPHAMDQLQDFLRQRRAVHEPVENLAAFEQELHRLFVAAEREALGQALSALILMSQRWRSTGSVTIGSCGVPRRIRVQ